MKYKNEDIKWAEELLEVINEKEIKVVKRSADKVPYTTVDGAFDDWSDEGKINWWTNGFYPGLLWLLYDYSGEGIYKDVAEKIEAKMDKNLMDYRGLDHDNGFKWLLTAVADYKITGNEASFNRAMLAASNLAGRINLKAGLIRAWNDNGSGETSGWAIIDCLMNLPLLYWASEVLSDSRFKQIAMLHADNAAKYFIRENGSVKHIVTFDSETGKYIKSLGGQGKEHGSSWTRGQSWALYGFTLSYMHTGKKEYLEAACRVGDYISSEVGEDGIIPVDFCQDKDIDWEDSTAAAIMACGYLELCKLVEGDQETRYYNTAMKLLKTLASHSMSKDSSVDYLLTNCSAAYNDSNHNFSIIYGDYYFVEALLKLKGNGLFLW